MTEVDPLTVINALCKTDKYIEHIYTQGGCYQFHLFLKVLFPQARPLIWNKDHIVSSIDGVLYDINGIVPSGQALLYRSLKRGELGMARKWSFYKNSHLRLGRCSACGKEINYKGLI